MPKFLFLDTEATGTDTVQNGIIQLAGLIYTCDLKAGIEPVTDFNIRANAYGAGYIEAEWDEKQKDGTVIHKRASDVHGKLPDEIMSYPEYSKAYKELTETFSRYVDKFDKSDKFTTIGYNIQFDVDMVRAMAAKCGDKYINSYIGHQTIDVMDVARLADAMGLLPVKPENHKLETICNIMEVDISAHDALSDIVATRDLLFKLVALFKN